MEARMPVKPPFLVGIAVSLAFALPAFAAEPTKQQCVLANETGQDLRRTGKLAEAIERFELCASAACPSVLSDDCTLRLNDARKAMPTIVLVARDAASKQVVPAEVTIDGGRNETTGEASRFSLDPGDHTFVFKMSGYVAASKSVHLNEKQNANVEVDLEKETVARPPPPPGIEPASSLSQASPAPIDENRGSGQRTLGYVLGGAGIVALGLGTYFGLSASSTYDDAVKSCGPFVNGGRDCNGTGLTQGSKADDQALVSTISFAAGAALITGAIVLLLTAPRHTSSSAPSHPKSALAPIPWDVAFRQSAR